MDRQEKVFYEKINATTSGVVDNVKNEIKKRKKEHMEIPKLELTPNYLSRAKDILSKYKKYMRN
jgi:hypothetical protein